MSIKLAFWNKILNGTQCRTFSEKLYYYRNAEVFEKNLAKENGGCFFLNGSFKIKTSVW
jgi:hypothetical protein